MRENLSFKNIFQREMKLASYIIICVTIVVISLSYAMFFQVNENSTNQEVIAGDLTFTYTNGGEITDATEVCFLPMTEEESTLFTGECSYRFSVRNTGSLKANYTIKILPKEGNTIELNKVKVILKKKNGESLQNVFESQKLLSELTDNVLVVEEMDSHQNIVYSIQLYIEESLYEDEDENKKISFQIEGSGLVHEDNPIETEENIATNYIKNLARSSEEIVSDDTVDNNLRYIGSNPNNYVSFNNELWRIIGSFNNIDNGKGTKETRIKLIRNESIGSYSWDTSETSINTGRGVNEWSESKIMKLLNPGYESESVGGSLYWNRGSGTCYNGQNNATTDCDFSGLGLTNEAKSLFSEVLWNTGSNGSNEYQYIIASKFYELERSDFNGKGCSENDACNDTVNRTTKWQGSIGLMYPSDYGFATNGGSVLERSNCLKVSLTDWNQSQNAHCSTNDWLFSSANNQWTMTPNSNKDFAVDGFDIRSDGHLNNHNNALANDIFPVLYLKSNVKIINGNGSLQHPFELSL